jgi:hypothetical protein
MSSLYPDSTAPPVPLASAAQLWPWREGSKSTSGEVALHFSELAPRARIQCPIIARVLICCIVHC